MKRPLLAFGLLLAACGNNANDGASTDTGDDRTGALVYAEPDAAGNSFACATCHAVSEPADDGILRAGNPLAGATRRATFKNGQLASLLDASNSCREEWMGAPAWTESSEDWGLLRDWLDAQTGAEAEVRYTVVDPPADLAGGDADRGRAFFNSSCAICHGQDAAGTPRGPALGGFDLSPEHIATRVRKSGSTDSGVYDGLVGGRMPFFSEERLDDDDLLDIVAFVATAEAVEPTNNETNAAANNAANIAPGRDCGATHAKVGQTMRFSTIAHDVSGTAEIVDDCTIEVTNFVFDGGGIDVRVYAGLGGDYDNGFPVSGDLFGTAYNGGTLTLKLPETRSLDDLDGLSVWCVGVGVSFGDGQFR